MQNGNLVPKLTKSGGGASAGGDGERGTTRGGMWRSETGWVASGRAMAGQRGTGQQTGAWRMVLSTHGVVRIHGTNRTERKEVEWIVGGSHGLVTVVRGGVTRPRKTLMCLCGVQIAGEG